MTRISFLFLVAGYLLAAPKYSPGDMVAVVTHAYVCGRVDGMAGLAEALGRPDIVSQVRAAVGDIDCSSDRQVAMRGGGK